MPISFFKKAVLLSSVFIFYIKVFSSETNFISTSANTIWLDDTFIFEALPEDSLFISITNNDHSLFEAFSRNWMSYGYKDKGLEQTQQTISLEGIPLINDFNEKPNWNITSGLNAVTKKFDYFTDEFETSQYSSHNKEIGSFHNYSLESSLFKKQTQLNFSQAFNNSYNNRLGLQSFWENEEKQTSTGGIGTLRWRPNDQTLPPYFSSSLFFTFEKKFSKTKKLNLSLIGSYIKKEKGATLTKEVQSLTSNSYNPNWGIYQNKRRSTKESELLNPLFLTTYTVNKPSYNLKTSIAIETPIRKNRRIFRGSGYYKDNTLNTIYPPSIDPTYYQYLPSYYEDQGLDASLADFFNTTSDMVPIKNGQTNWDFIYSYNSSLAEEQKPTAYFLGSDVQKEQKISIRQDFIKNTSEKKNLSLSILCSKSLSTNFVLVEDLLGGNPFIDANSFYSGSLALNNLENPYKEAFPGEKVDYFYKFNTLKASSSVNYSISSYKILWNNELNIGYRNSQRIGNFKNARYANSSRGSSNWINFYSAKISSSFIHKFSTTHYLKYSAVFSSSPISNETVFFDTQYSNLLTPNNGNKKSLGFQISHTLNTSNFSSYINLFHRSLWNETTIQRNYVSTFEDFTNQAITNTAKTNTGLELSFKKNINEYFSINYSSLIGKFLYTNNPSVYLLSQSDGEIKSIGTSSLKGYHLGEGPEKLFNLGVSYKSKKFLIAGVSLSFIDDIFARPSALRRTNYFNFSDVENQVLYDSFDEEKAKELLTQEKLASSIMTNLNFFKGWKTKKGYLIGLSIFINNLFNIKDFALFGFEQSRYITYEELLEEQNRETPLFGNKYWFLRGQSIFINFYTKFL